VSLARITLALTFFFSVTVDVIFENCINFASTFSRMLVNRSNIKSMHRSKLNMENNVNSVIVKRTSDDSRRTSLVLLIVLNHTVSGPTKFEISV